MLNGDEEVPELKAAHLAGKFHVEWDEEGRCHLLHGRVVRADGICVLTICYENQADRDWAVRTAASAYASPPEAD